MQDSVQRVRHAASLIESNATRVMEGIQAVLTVVIKVEIKEV